MARPASRSIAFAASCVLLTSNALAQTSSTTSTTSTTSTAAPTVTSPSEELLRGARLLEAMDAASAIAPLERAARGGAGPLAWFNLGLAYRAVGRRRAAIAAWDRYLSEPEADVPAERLSAVRSERATLVEQCARLELTLTPERAQVRIDNESLSSESDATVAAASSARVGTRRRSWLLDPGEHRIEALASGYAPWTSQVLLRERERRSIEVTLVRAAVETTGEPPRPFAPWWTWIGASALAVGAITATALAVDAQRIYDDCRADPARCATNEGSVQASLDGRSAGVAVGASVAGAGLAVFVTGIIVGRVTAARPRR